MAMTAKMKFGANLVLLDNTCASATNAAKGSGATLYLRPNHSATAAWEGGKSCKLTAVARPAVFSGNQDSKT
jgi:hypothetical protein